MSESRNDQIGHPRGRQTRKAITSLPSRLRVTPLIWKTALSSFLILGFCWTSRAAALDYDPVFEWDGPTFRTALSSSDEDTDSPAIDVPFVAPFAIAAQAEPDDRDLIYVVDSGNRRVQAFEANATFEYLTQNDLSFADGGATTASEWDTDQIHFPNWALTADRWISPGSEAVRINGILWTYIADLTGTTAADQVYNIDYTDATSTPLISFPANSLTNVSSFSIQYVLSDNQTGATDAYGIGDIDYGIGTGGSPVLVNIDGSSGGPSSFQTLRAAAISENYAVSSTDDVFLLDSADDSGNLDETLVLYNILSNGTVNFVEAYDDSLTSPYGISVDRTGTTYPATVSVSSNLGFFDQNTAIIIDDSQVTGHGYTVSVSAGDVTIVDSTTGRILVDAAAVARFADPYLGIPGLSLPTQGGTDTIVINTTPTRPDRYLFVADTGAHEIRIVPAADAPTLSGDWLPSDSHSVITLDFLNIGQIADVDYAESSPASVPSDWTFRTAARPVRQGSLEEITFATDGTWTRVDDLGTAGPTDKVYEVDWDAGRITFGDDTDGEIPPGSEEIYYTYDATLEAVRYGGFGGGAGNFDSPEGIAARWNSALGAFDVYVADTGNDRIQKLAFYQEDAALGLEARVEYVTSWTVTSGVEVLGSPSDIAVRADGDSPATIWVGVADTDNDRVVLYEDTAAATGTNDTTAPTYESEFGTSGTGVGEYQVLKGIDFLPNGTGLDIYTADASRGVITKYEPAPDPDIEVSWGAAACYPPSGSYTFSFVVTNPPTGGVVDWYYDTASEYDDGTSIFAIGSASIGATETSATWTFADTPAGPPGSGTYYIFARVKNSSGDVVATDSSAQNETICIDGTLVPTVALRDAMDGDGTLSFQNGTSRILEFDIAYPDSAVSVSYRATFDPDLFAVRSVSRGTAWDGIGAISYFFDWSVDSTLGVIEVSSSALGTPFGLTEIGPHNVANVELVALPDILDLGTRFVDSEIELQTAGTSMVNLDGEVSPDLRREVLDMRLAFLGDLATDDEGAGGTVPNLAPNPDGYINFADVLAFAIGWNGVDFQRDPISDLAPASGIPPYLVSDPDGVWDIDDVVVLTQMYSWAGSMGFTGSFSGPEDGPEDSIESANFLSNSTLNEGKYPTVGDRSNGDGPKLLLHGAAGHHTAGSTSLLQIEVQSGRELFGASVILEFDPGMIEIEDIEQGEVFARDGTSLFLKRIGRNWLEITATSLQSNRAGSEEPAVREGILAHLTVRALRDGEASFRLRHDFRSKTNRVLSRGRQVWGNASEVPVRLDFSILPSPTRGPAQFQLRLPQTSTVHLDLFDVAGRRVRRLIEGESLSGGWHIIAFDGQTQEQRPLAPGIYFSRLATADERIHRKLVVY